MKYKKEQLNNEALIEAIHKMTTENSGESQQEMLKILAKSELYIPTKLSPVPKKTSDGRYMMTPKTKISFISAHQKVGEEDKGYFLAFSDNEAYKKWAAGKKYEVLTASFDDYAVMLFRPGATFNGIILNPGTDTITITKGAVKQVIKHTSEF